jgi:hypothetical protein
MEDSAQSLQTKAQDIKGQQQSNIRSTALDKRATITEENIDRNSTIQRSIEGSGSDKKEKAPDVSGSSSQHLRFLDGYKLRDLLQAPIRPPEPIVTEGVSETSDRRVIVLVVIGAALVCLSIGCLLVDQIKVGIAFLVLGAVVVMTAVFAPIP